VIDPVIRRRAGQSCRNRVGPGFFGRLGGRGQAGKPLAAGGVEDQINGRDDIREAGCRVIDHLLDAELPRVLKTRQVARRVQANGMHRGVDFTAARRSAVAQPGFGQEIFVLREERAAQFGCAIQRCGVGNASLVVILDRNHIDASQAQSKRRSPWDMLVEVKRNTQREVRSSLALTAEGMRVG
jgi:hypothetical protein